MRTRRLGNTGLVVSRLALGTRTWGRDTNADEAGDELTTFLDAGGTLIDTADLYSGGAAESILGELIAGRARHDVIVATTAGGQSQIGAGGSRRHLLAALDSSLDRLQTDHVDLWQLHLWDATTPLEETLAALDDAVTSGRARYTGVSNFTGWQTTAAATWQRAWPGRTPLASTQVEYSLLARGVEAEVLPAAEHSGLGLLAWSPLGRGVLTGKYRRSVPADSRAQSEIWGDFVRPYLNEGSAHIVDAVATAADGLGVSVLAVALAWVRDRPGVTAAVVGARTQRQLADILAAETLELPDSIRSALDDVSA